jgi:acetyl esterase/lipase
MSLLLLLVAALGALLAWAAVRRPRVGGPSWLPSMVGAELAPLLLVAMLAAAGGFAAAGWADGRVGTAGVLVSGLASAGFVLAVVRSTRVKPAAERAVSAFLGEPVRLPRVDPLAIMRPYRGTRRTVAVDAGLSYGPHPRHVVDRTARGDARRPAPAFIHFHGGGWWRGNPGRQGRPLLHRLAADGWVVLTPSYRLSPEATFPDHLVDAKRVVAWVRDHADALGVDPAFIAVGGGSVGAQLATLVALTAGDPELQPGFEGSDASVQAAVPFYGVHDPLDESGSSARWPYLVSEVFKVSPALDAGPWLRATSRLAATPDRPPFFVVHGAADGLVPSADSARLVEALRRSGGPAVGYLEVPWGNHGFDFFSSIRALHTAEAVAVVLRRLYDMAAGRSA